MSLISVPLALLMLNSRNNFLMLSCSASRRNHELLCSVIVMASRQATEETSWACSSMMCSYRPMFSRGSCSCHRCPVDGCSYCGMSMGLYEHVMAEHAHEVSSVACLEAITMTLQRSSWFLLLVLHDNIRKLFLLLNINNANGAEIEDM